MNKKLNNLFAYLLFGFGVICGAWGKDVIATRPLEARSDNIQKEDKCRRGYPFSIPILEREGYALAYNGQTRIPLWVYEELTPNSFVPNAKRKNCFFRLDPDIPPQIQASTADYAGMGFDRGHMAPAEDCSFSQKAMQETFFFSNIAPQTIRLNRGCWRLLEEHVKMLTLAYGKIDVITGPLFLAASSEDGRRYVKYQVIGKNNIAVPTHFFKVIGIGEGNQRSHLVYIIPNQTIENGTSLEKYATSKAEVEQLSGIFFR